MDRVGQWWVHLSIGLQGAMALIGFLPGILLIGDRMYAHPFDKLSWEIARTPAERRHILACETGIRLAVGLAGIVALASVCLPAVVLMRLGMPLLYAAPIGVVLGVALAFALVISLEAYRHKNRQSAKSGGTGK